MSRIPASLRFLSVQPSGPCGYDGRSQPKGDEQPHAETSTSILTALEVTLVQGSHTEHGRTARIGIHPLVDHEESEIIDVLDAILDAELDAHDVLLHVDVR